MAFTSCLRSGALGVVFARFDPEEWFWAHQEYQITDLGVVPPLAIMAINHPLNKKYSLKSVKIAAVGAAPLDKQPQARLQKLIGEDVPLTQVWGMTETSCIATRFPYPERDTTGSVGRPLPNIDLKLVDDNGKDISGYDVRGELCVRGPTVVNGYFENPEANGRDWDEDRFFHTGDIAYIDGKTNLWYIVDRKKVRRPCHSPYSNED
jgi:long-subunit acyl-CoA synthetase (AMP-forming)